MHTPLQLLLMPQATDPALAEHVRGAIERLLERKRVTQAQVGRASGIQSQQINRYVRGHETPGLDNLARILRGAGADWYEWAQAWDEAAGKEPARLARVALEPPPPVPASLVPAGKLREAAESLRLAAEALARAIDSDNDD